MATKIFLAGASGAVGRPLVQILREAGHSVTGTTRTPEGRDRLEAMGITAVIADVFDGEAISDVMQAATPEIVIHQLTDLSNFDPASPEEAVFRNARLRREGTANLVAAAVATGVKRFVVQSIGWAYAPKAPPFVESDPLDVHATGPRATTVLEGIVPLERAVLEQSSFEGVVLRYGQFYGPGTWSAVPSGSAPLQVESAAYAAFLAMDHGGPGVYNVADPGGVLSIEKALRELTWRPDFRLASGRKTG